MINKMFKWLRARFSSKKRKGVFDSDNPFLILSSLFLLFIVFHQGILELSRKTYSSCPSWFFVSFVICIFLATKNTKNHKEHEGFYFSKICKNFFSQKLYT